MIELKGHQLSEKVYESEKTVVYRGIKEENNKPIVVKFIRTDYPTIQEVRQLESEYRIGKNLDIAGVVKYYSIENVKHSKALVIEDFGGLSLNKYISSKEPELEEILEISIAITGILDDIHQQNIIHKDINRNNILINPETKEVKIIDFSIAAEVEREIQAVVNAEKIEGTLAYISPEQTGRMNRSVDFRSDFYSFGVTLYEMLTGKLPFEAKDSVELIHFHIAREVVPPHEIKAGIPPVISRIVTKLLSKTAEGRYQSSLGLKADLEKCYNQLKETGKIEDFTIGEEDISEKFQIPEKLYGREKEINHLMSLFDRVSGGSKEMVYFSGVSGIGKSALINEIQKSIVEKRAYFITGKYDQFKKDIPYTAIIQAFQECIKQLLTESDEELDRWKNDILEAVGDNGQVIIDVIPDIEFIIGLQKEVQPLPPTEAQNRFNMVFQNFIKIFASEAHLLVIFIDDFQWADNASLTLLDILLSDPELNYLLFIGAYRDNEIDNSHPFVSMLDNMEKEGVSWEDIKLTPLTIEDIGEMLSDVLYSERAKTENLSRLVYSKTDGNPFFVKEFLKTLYKDSLIVFEQGWLWDIDKIEQARITDNVVELMANKIETLSETTLNILKLAACIGSKFYMDTLSLVYGKAEDETFEDLKEALNEGMILKIEDNLRFIHDKVREASYSLIDKEEQKRLHCRIGMIMLDKAKKEEDVENRIFNIVNQLNFAKELLVKEEKDELIELNFKAGLKAKVSTAYEAAVQFFKHGAEILADNSWEMNYDITLSLYIEWAEAAYITTHFEDAEKLFDIILKNAKTLFDKIKVHILRISHYTAQMKLDEALEVGRKALKQLGVTLPEKPGEEAVGPELTEAKTRLGKRKIEDLINQPEFVDQKMLAILNILQVCAVPAYLSNPNLLLVIAMKTVNLSLKYGNDPTSPLTYSYYAIILSAAVGDINSAYDFSKLTLKLADKYGIKLMQGKAFFHYPYTAHLKEHLKNNLNYQVKAYQYFLEAGDLLYASYAYMHYGYTHILVGENLNTVKEMFDKYTPLIYRLKQEGGIVYFNIWKQSVQNFSGDSEDKLLIKGESFNEEEMVPKLFESNDVAALAYYYIPKIMICYLYEEYSKGVEIGQNEQLVFGGVLGQSCSQVFPFFYALTLSALYLNSDKKEQKEYLQKLNEIQENFKKWGEIGKYNYLHKYHLISAEIARITGKDEEAKKLYDEAIKGAGENGFIHEEAIANECAAKFYLSREMQKFAGSYMTDAYQCYRHWGAKLKMEDLQEEYSSLINLEEEI